MAGFNTLVLITAGRAVVATYAASWDDQLNVSCAAYSNTGPSISDGDAGRSSWTDYNRLISVYKVQGVNSSLGAQTVAARLYDATAAVTIYSFSAAIALGASTNVSGNPLASYTLPIGNVLRSMDSGSNGLGSGVSFLFASVPIGAAGYNFDGNANLVGEVLFANFNGGFAGVPANAVTASYATAKTLELWKIQMANASNDGVAAVGLSRADSFKLYDGVAGITIYTVVNPGIIANGTIIFIGTPLTTYSLPANNTIMAALDTVVTPGVLGPEDVLMVGMALSCT